MALPSPFPRLPIILSLHQFVGFYSEGFGQLPKRAWLGTMPLVLQLVDVVECHPASLFQFTKAEHPAPPKLPKLCPIYLYESLHNNQHFTYILLTNQPECEKIWVS